MRSCTVQVRLCCRSLRKSAVNCSPALILSRSARPCCWLSLNTAMGISFLATAVLLCTGLSLSPLLCSLLRYIFNCAPLVSDAHLLCSVTPQRRSISIPMQHAASNSSLRALQLGASRPSTRIQKIKCRTVPSQPDNSRHLPGSCSRNRLVPLVLSAHLRGQHHGHAVLPRLWKRNIAHGHRPRHALHHLCRLHGVVQQQALAAQH